MRTCVVALVLFVLLGVGVAYAQEYVPWQTFGQVSPDRVLAERTRLLLIPDEVYAPYTPTARYAFGAVTDQIPPERALESRREAGTDALLAMPYTVRARYAPGCVCTQISPDRVLAERVAYGF